jgi:hypothetical protein
MRTYVYIQEIYTNCIDNSIYLEYIPIVDHACHADIRGNETRKERTMSNERLTTTIAALLHEYRVEDILNQLEPYVST